MSDVKIPELTRRMLELLNERIDRNPVIWKRQIRIANRDFGYRYVRANSPERVAHCCAILIAQVRQELLVQVREEIAAAIAKERSERLSSRLADVQGDGR